MAAIVSLPLENLQAIASELWLSDLSALIRTHRRLYLLLTHSLYQYNKEHHNGSALAWGVRHGVIKTTQYAIQQNCDLGAIYEPGWEYKEDLPYDYSYDPCSGLKLLNVAIHRVDYAMTRLLVESGAEVHDTDINLASCGSCQAMIWNLTPSHGSSYGQTPDPGPDDPRSIALRAAIQMGHDELVDLISEKDQTDIPSLFSPIWPSLVETVRSYEARVSIIRLLLEKVAGQQNRRYLLSRYDERGCCDVTLKLFWEKEKSLTRHKHSIDPGAVSTAAFRGNKPLLGTFIEMGGNLNSIDRHNRTPIMWAAYSGRFDIVKLLIERGADAFLKRDAHITTLSLASKIGSSPRDRKDPFWYQDKGEKRKIVDYLMKQPAGKQSKKLLWKSRRDGHMETMETRYLSKLFRYKLV